MMNKSEKIMEHLPFQLDGTPNTKLGWIFQPEKETEYIPFDVCHIGKGGRIQSPRIHLGKSGKETGFFRLKFEAKASEPGYWWIDLYDAQDNLLPDMNSALYATGSMRKYEEVIFTDSQAESVVIAFVVKSDTTVQNITLESISAGEAADWCDRQYAEITAEKFTAPANAFDRLPGTREALHTGKPWKILMLGDSLINDTWTSNFQSLVMRDFPSAKLEFMLSVRPSTGCWYYHEPENFREYAAEYQPDLVMIGGISNIPMQEGLGDPMENMITVIQHCHKLGCEVVIISPPHSSEYRTTADKKIVWDEHWTNHRGVKCLLSDYQRAAAAKTEVAFWDLTSFPCETIDKSGKPLGWFNRDTIHNNDRGKQLIGQTLAAWFRRAK